MHDCAHIYRFREDILFLDFVSYSYGFHVTTTVIFSGKILFIYFHYGNFDS